MLETNFKTQEVLNDKISYLFEKWLQLSFYLKDISWLVSSGFPCNNKILYFS
jgi:hypothetical protein